MVAHLAGGEMNLVILAALSAAVLVWLWVVQFAAVRWAGDGKAWAWPLAHGSDSPKVRGAMKAALAVGLVALLIAHPALTGRDPLRYHLDRLTPAHFGSALATALGVFATLTMLFAASVALGWIRLEKRHGHLKLAGKIVKGMLIPVPLTLMEEPIFRGLLLEELCGVMPAAAAVVVSAAIFAVAHFLRPQKRRAMAAIALFYTGVMLGSAYLLAGHNYLLPAALHAGGVMFIQMTRPVSYYVGPAWLIGRSSYPIAGLLNMSAVTLTFILMSL
jgi:membrane protease YdiL (CAAX protease family)